MVDGPIAVGVIGAGSVASTVHLPVLRSMPDVSLAWIADRDALRARNVARAHRIAHVALARSPGQLPPADVVLLAIPYGARAPYYELLRGTGVALFVEKPLFRTPEEHRRACSWFEDFRMAHGFQRRSLGSTQLVRQLVDDGLFGALRSIRCGLGQPGILTRGGYVSDLGQAGGGILFETGVHLVDTALFVTRASGVEVSRSKMILDRGFDLHTEARLTLTLPSGGNAECEIVVSCLQETSNRLELELEGARVSYSIFDPSGRVLVRAQGRESDYQVARGDGRPFARTTFQTMYLHWSAFLEGFRARRANHTSAHDALLTTKALAGCYEVGAGC